MIVFLPYFVVCISFLSFIIGFSEDENLQNINNSFES